MQNGWKRIGRMLAGTAIKKWHKKYTHRQNRRKANRTLTTRTSA